MIQKYNIKGEMYVAEDSKAQDNENARFIWTPEVPTLGEEHGYNKPFPVTVTLGEGDHLIRVELQAQNHKPDQQFQDQQKKKKN